MADTLKLRGGTTSEHKTGQAGFTGADREVTVDTTKKTLCVHDGTTLGGTPLMREEGNSGSQTSNVKFATSGTDAIAIDSSQRVGIGVGSPTDKLEVNGNIRGTLSRFGNGTVSTPTYSFQSDQDTGMYRSLENTISFATGGEERLIIGNQGQLIIKKGSSLDLVNGFNNSSSRIQNAGGSDQSNINFLTRSGTSEIISMTLMPNGNCGIGTTNPNSLSKLDVAGKINLSGTDTAFVSSSQPLIYRSGSDAGSYPFNNFGHLVLQSRGDGSNRDIIFATGASGANMTAIKSDGQVTINEGGSGNGILNINGAEGSSEIIKFSRGGTEASRIGHSNSGDLTFSMGSGVSPKFTIKANGNCGIGTTLPLSDLHIASSLATIRLQDSDVANGTAYSLITSSSNGNIEFSADPDGDRSDSDLRFHVDGIEIMRMDTGSGTNKNVLIGRETAGNTGNGHTIRGDDSAVFSRDSNTGETVQISRNTTDGPLINFRKGDTGNATSISNISTTTTAGTTTVAYNTGSSDRALKKNFESWNEDVLNLFKNINPQKFNFINQNDGDDKTKGFVAQDMVGSFPEAYTKGGEDDAKYMFNPSGMVVYLMKAIQELQAKVEALEAA